MLPLLICVWTHCNSPSYHLTCKKKKKKKKGKGGSRKRADTKRKRKKKDNNKPPADFKPVQQVLLVFLDATGRGGWTSLFSLPLVLRGWGPGLGRTIQFPSLWPRSSMRCQAQVNHSSAYRLSQSLARSVRLVGCTVPLYYHLQVLSDR